VLLVHAKLDHRLPASEVPTVVAATGVLRGVTESSPSAPAWFKPQPAKAELTNLVKRLPVCENRPRCVAGGTRDAGAAALQVEPQPARAA